LFTPPRKKGYEEKRAIRFLNDDQKLLYKSLNLNKIFSNTSQEFFPGSKENTESKRRIPNFNLVKREASELSLNMPSQPTDRHRSPRTGRLNSRMETWTTPVNQRPGINKKIPTGLNPETNPQTTGANSNNNRKEAKFLSQKVKPLDEDEYLHNFIRKKPVVKT
jgi:hypothetical protein